MSQTVYEPRVVAPVGDAVGEAVTWCPEEDAVYWVDVCRFLIHRLHWPSEQTRSWLFDEPVVALSLTSEPGRFLVALGSSLWWWWPASDRREPLSVALEGWPQVRFNDGRSDRSGRFWIGTMRNNVRPDGEVFDAGGEDGVLYRFDTANARQTLLTGIGISNTLCWSPDERVFYTADTLKNLLWAFDYEPITGSLGERRVLLGPDTPGLPDGSAIDAEGYVWNCRLVVGQVMRVAPNGRIERVVSLPVPHATSAAFGGADLRTLFVSTASLNKAPGQRFAGALWAIRCEVPGLPPDRVDLTRFLATEG